MLESALHESSVFSTLTYDEEHLPADRSVSVKAGQDFIRSLRKRTGFPLRYFLVGEYGDRTERPHYHAALFGLPACSGDVHVRHTVDCRCESCSVVASAWDRGGTSLGELNLSTAQYIAGYTTKKMTKADDVRLDGRAPEFARMSLRPGIGAWAMDAAAAVLSDSVGAAAIGRLGDVPNELQHGLKKMPLGRYLKGKLREALGVEFDYEKFLKQNVADLLALSEAQGSVKAALETLELERVSGVKKIKKRAVLFPKVDKL